MMTRQELTIEQVPMGSLRPDPANPRRISDAELEALTKSIHQFGLIERVAETMDDEFVLGPLTAYGRDLAVELVTLAKAEALATLGEQNAGVRLVEEWVRSTRF